MPQLPQILKPNDAAAVILMLRGYLAIDRFPKASVQNWIPPFCDSSLASPSRAANMDDALNKPPPRIAWLARGAFAAP